MNSRAAANAVPLPKPKPRAVREHLVVPSIHSREVASAQRSGVRRCEDVLKALDFGNSLLGVHSVSISNMSVAIVKRSGIATLNGLAVPFVTYSPAESTNLLIWGQCFLIM
jgi:hypothetical protein